MSRFHRTDEGIYKDAGCILRPRCLTCDLPGCYLDLRLKQNNMGTLAFDVKVSDTAALIRKEDPDMGPRTLARRIAEMLGARTRNVRRSQRRWENTWGMLE